MVKRYENCPRIYQMVPMQPTEWSRIWKALILLNMTDIPLKSMKNSKAIKN